MDAKFLMGQNDGLIRSVSTGDPSTYVSPGLGARLMAVAIKKACDFYSGFFGTQAVEANHAALVKTYQEHLQQALLLGLLKAGGIREKDHVSLWCLGQVLGPEVYLESGVFMGSSLHALLGAPGLRRVIAIDPDPSQLRVPAASIPGAELISDRDFSQLKLDLSGTRALAYFDDHIDTADRILQAVERGFRFVLFDDSTGLEGVCQRLFPAVPTVPMIMNASLLLPGDELAWTFGGSTRVSLRLTPALIDKCHRARAVIRKCERTPDLGEFVPQLLPERTPDTSKYLLELGPT